ncbi:MAG: hypothetical protein ACK2TV_04535 [Anaerolineales bacterium]
MKKILATIILLGVGLIVLAGYFFKVQLNPLISLIFEWGFILLGFTGINGIAYLIWLHFSKIIQREKGFVSSILVLLAFSFTLIAGFVLTSQNAFFQAFILNVQVPVEASLLALFAVTLLYASLRLIRTQGWTPMSIGFLASALISLVFDLGIINAETGTLGAELLAFLHRLPLVGARGILLGMALGGLMVGLRVLLKMNRFNGE